MTPKRITDATVEPVSLAEAKLHLRVDHADEDALITRLIKVARVAAEDRTERSLITTTWQITLDAFPDAIALPMPPLLSVTSLQYIDLAGVLRTLSPADYIVDTASQPGYVVPGVDKAWPDTQARINAVTVTYTAGYGATAADVPAPITQWILLAIGDMYANRARSADKPVVPQRFADGLLDLYRMMSF